MNSVPLIYYPTLPEGIMSYKQISGYPMASLSLGIEPAIWPLARRLNTVAEEARNYNEFGASVVVNSWLDMVDELANAGYTATKVSHLTGISRRTIQRWFNGTEEIPRSHRLFANVLCIYCRYKCFGEKI